jgi:hypothetical protein
VKLAEISNQVSMLFLRNAAIAILVLCAIGIGTATAAERGRERVLIGVSSKSIGFFDVWAAHEKGFFANTASSRKSSQFGPTYQWSLCTPVKSTTAG